MDDWWMVELGREYLVLGLDFYLDSPTNGTGIYVDILYEPGGYMLSVPLALFTVTDPRCSRYWDVYQGHDGLSLAPPELFQDGFNDLLSDGDPETVAEFQEVYNLLSTEFDTPDKQGRGDSASDG